MYTVYMDLDGTLLDNNKKIPEHTYECLSAFVNQGNFKANAGTVRYVFVNEDLAIYQALLR